MKDLEEGLGGTDRQCRRCSDVKPLVEFARYARYPGGFDTMCKQCGRIAKREGYARNRDRILERQKGYNASPQARALLKARAPERQRARKLVKDAMRYGKLIRRPCEVCGNEKVDAHHPDYTQPLAVQWLCRSHHMELHRKESA